MLLLLPAHLVGAVWVGSELQQQRHSLIVPVLNSQVQRRPADLAAAAAS
jgi:hypothetical protein